MGMENKDFRRRLLDQEMPIDAGAFGRVMERRKAGGAGTAWIGKGIWAAALLVATAGIGLFVERTHTSTSGQGSTGAKATTNAAEPAVQTAISESNTAAYPSTSETSSGQTGSVTGAGPSNGQRSELAAGRLASAGRSRRLAQERGTPQLEVPLDNSGRGHMETGRASEPEEANGSGRLPLGSEGWTALMRRPLQIHTLFRTPKTAGALDMPCSDRAGQRFVQTEWLAEPGWVFKQSPAGAALRRQERFAGAGAFTARLVFPANRGFQWVSGIRYQEWVDHFNFSQEHTAMHQRIDAYDVIIRVPGQPDRTETRYDTTQMQVTRLESYTDINRYRMIGLPLAFRWSPVENGIWYVQAGITPSYMVYRGGSRRLNDGTVVSIAEGANINRFQLHAGLAAGMRRFVAPRVAMLLEPGIGYNMTPFASGPLRQRNLQLSLSAGLMFHLGR